MIFTDEQNAVLDGLERFLANPEPGRMYRCVSGLAGSGKSTVLAELARRHPEALLCAPFGRTAAMLTRRTGIQASTVHSAIYRFLGEYENDDGELRLGFASKVKEGAWRGEIALIDESEVINQWLAEDLLNTECKVIAVGDNGQLPPVRGERFFQDADFELKQIHRQALDSAIIRQAHAVRNYGVYESDGDDFRVAQYVDRDDILNYDIIICWKNATRRALNRLKRAHLGLDMKAPQAGEPVMCLNNDQDASIMNGGIYRLERNVSLDKPRIRIVNDIGEEVELKNTWFEDVYGVGIKDSIGFAYAYASTCHKLIGSEVERAIVVDEYTAPAWRREWLYTSFSRSKKQVIVQRS